MLLQILDGDGFPQTVIWQSQQTPTDRSGTIASTGVSQPVMESNTNRSGFLFQNLGASPMSLSEIGADATAPGAVVVYPGDTFPPRGYPVPTTAVNVAGTAGEAYTAREW